MPFLEGPQNNLRNPYKQTAIPMDELTYGGLTEEQIWAQEREQEAKKKSIAAKCKATRAANAKKRRRSTARQTTEARGKAVKRSQTSAMPAKRPVKSLPPMKTPGEQPRDSLGRFASRAGAVLWNGTKAVAQGTGKAVRGTAKAVKSTHRAIKRSNAAARRRAALEHRERSLALRERAAKLKGKSRKNAGKGKAVQRKQGFLSKLIFGRRKR